MGLLNWFTESVMGNTFMVVFLIAAIGYLVGSIKIKGIEIGTAGVLLVALIFGHFGFSVPKEIGDLGLILFVTSVGFIAGPKFFRNFKVNAKNYILLGFVIILVGALTTIAVIKLGSVPKEIGVGMMAGALTSTPGLAAAQEAAAAAAAAGEGDMAQSLASVGYGVAYPFGVIGVVLFVQLIPKFLKLDMAKERAEFEAASGVSVKTDDKKYFRAEPMGFLPLALAIALGIILAKIKIPLPGGAEFSLGTSGGPLIAGLILGHFGHIGKLSLKVEKNVLECMREFGLCMFLLGAGTGAGANFVRILKEQGAVLFLYGALITLVPMILGYIVASKVLKLRIFNTLGSICGGMTSTPALGTLISVTGTDDVASAYAATYPIALVCVVLSCQFIGLLL